MIPRVEVEKEKKKKGAVWSCLLLSLGLGTNLSAGPLNQRESSLRFFRQKDSAPDLTLCPLSGRTEIKKHPHIPCPPKPGEDGWSELITGAFAKR